MFVFFEIYILITLLFACVSLSSSLTEQEEPISVRQIRLKTMGAQPGEAHENRVLSQIIAIAH